MGTVASDIEHHQAGAEEEPSGGSGCSQVLRLERDVQQPEVHELYRSELHHEKTHKNIIIFNH